MAFNANDITTDGMMGWMPWKRSAEPALLESQLVLIRYNSERIHQKIDRGRGTKKDIRELRMWHEMNNVILGEIKVHVIDAHGSPQGFFIISTTQGSMFDELSKCLDFNRWLYVSLCTSDENNKSNHEWGSNGMRDYESFKKEIDCDVRRRISQYRKRGLMLHFEIKEIPQDFIKDRQGIHRINKGKGAVVKEDEQIELRIIQSWLEGCEKKQISIQNPAKSVFVQIGDYVAYDDWGSVVLTDGVRTETLYEEKSTAKHITMQPSAGERRFKFDLDFMEGIKKIRNQGGEKEVYLEITKRFIADTWNESVTPDEALAERLAARPGSEPRAERLAARPGSEPRAETLAARFQSITWV
jgi:hypothetical protein